MDNGSYLAFFEAPDRPFNLQGPSTISTSHIRGGRARRTLKDDGERGRPRAARCAASPITISSIRSTPRPERYVIEMSEAGRNHDEHMAQDQPGARAARPLQKGKTEALSAPGPRMGFPLDHLQKARPECVSRSSRRWPINPPARDTPRCAAGSHRQADFQQPAPQWRRVALMVRCRPAGRSSSAPSCFKRPTYRPHIRPLPPRKSRGGPGIVRLVDSDGRSPAKRVFSVRCFATMSRQIGIASPPLAMPAPRIRAQPPWSRNTAADGEQVRRPSRPGARRAHCRRRRATMALRRQAMLISVTEAGVEHAVSPARACVRRQEIEDSRYRYWRPDQFVDQIAPPHRDRVASDVRNPVAHFAISASPACLVSLRGRLP